jgi:hypothetical protein
MKITFDVKYKLGHTYKETWEYEDYFCPGCGKQTVYQETGLGDYYMGSMCICLSCEHTFYLPCGVVKNDNFADIDQRISNIRAAEEKK